MPSDGWLQEEGVTVRFELKRADTHGSNGLTDDSEKGAGRQYEGDTRMNASSHKPQSRCGGTGPNVGNCFSQLCPNDAIPPQKP